MITHRFSPRFCRFLLAAVLSCISFACQVANCDPQAAAGPDVLVLVLSGAGPYDNVSINYASDISDKNAKSDLRKLVRATRWQVRDVKLTTETANTPGAKPTTSLSFSTPRIVSFKEGILPVEPFVNVFKRFKTIRINYLMTAPFQLAGLKDFDNEFVKVTLKQSGNSYEYTVLPLRSDTQAATSLPQAGMSTVMRIILTVALALLGAVFAYYVAARRRARE